MEAGDNLTFSFFDEKSGSTVYCELPKKMQFYHFSISERA